MSDDADKPGWVMTLVLLSFFGLLLYFLHWVSEPCRADDLSAAEERACLIAVSRAGAR